jgi:hypothetical protein
VTFFGVGEADKTFAEAEVREERQMRLLLKLEYEKKR